MTMKIAGVIVAITEMLTRRARCWVRTLTGNTQHANLVQQTTIVQGPVQGIMLREPPGEQNASAASSNLQLRHNTTIVSVPVVGIAQQAKATKAVSNHACKLRSGNNSLAPLRLGTRPKYTPFMLTCLLCIRSYLFGALRVRRIYKFQLHGLQRGGNQQYNVQ